MVQLATYANVKRILKKFDHQLYVIHKSNQVVVATHKKKRKSSNNFPQELDVVQKTSSVSDTQKEAK